jgi:hypothetical protein
MRQEPKPGWSTSPSVVRKRLHFGLAHQTEAFDGSFRLVHDQYVWRRYMAPHPTGRRLSLHHSLPSTKVFVAKAGSQVVGTLSLVQDSPVGLPMDEIYREELSGFRAQGRRVCEVSALAIDQEYRTSGVGILMRLVRLMMIYAAHVNQLDDMCIAVNPRHADFYLKAFRSSHSLGGVKEYRRVNGAPAVGVHLDLHFVRSQIAAVHGGGAEPGSLYRFFFWPGKFQRILARLHRDIPRSRWSPQQFAHFFSNHDALGKATAKQREFVRSFYADPMRARHHRPAASSLFGLPAARPPAFALGPS